jgi:hypothetical protein
MFGHFLEGSYVFIFLPVFRSFIYGCTCPRIFIQNLWSNLCRTKTKYLFVSIRSRTIFLNSALLSC